MVSIARLNNGFAASTRTHGAEERLRASKNRRQAMTVKTSFKITYSTLGANQEEFHREFDSALERVRGRLGKTYGHVIAGRDMIDGQTFPDVSPIDPSILIGNFASGGEDVVVKAFDAARQAWPGWRDTPWVERVKILRGAAELISRDKYDLAAAMALEVGKNRLEAMGDVEEAADLIRYYCQQMEDADGFERPLGRLSDSEQTKSVLRPTGVWAVVCPFNFPLALAAGMSSGALVAGNTVVFKPASEAPWLAIELARRYQEAGVPAGVFNLTMVPGNIFGDVLARSAEPGGVIFTGSKDVGMKIYHAFNQRYPRACILEMGGKNPSIVMRSADLDKAAEGTMRSAFGFGGQKCSACSRAYVHESVYEKFVDMLVEKTKTLKIGDPTQRDIYLGPLVTQAAVERYQQWVERAAADGGTVRIGGERLPDKGKGYFVAPTVITDLPKEHPLFHTEIFAPVLAVAPVESLAEAIALSNRAEYGLTAGLFSKEQGEIDRFFNEIESGVLYVNRRSGATTGAWPGVQSFCGWKGSGSSGKGGCGPYYVMQFMREQSRTVMS